MRGKADHGVIAMPAGKFVKAASAVAIGARDANRGDDVARAERGLEQAAKKLLRADAAAALRARNQDLAAERDQAGRKLGRRIGERDRAADRAAVADRDVADVRQRQSDERRL